NLIERGLLIVAAALLFYPDPIWDLVGLAFFVAGVMLHWVRVRGQSGEDPTPATASRRTGRQRNRPALDGAGLFCSRNSLPMLRLRLVVGGKIFGTTLQQDRAGRLANQLLGNAAKRPALVPALATRGHDQDVVRVDGPHDGERNGSFEDLGGHLDAFLPEDLGLFLEVRLRLIADVVEGVLVERRRHLQRGFARFPAAA